MTAIPEPKTSGLQVREFFSGNIVKRPDGALGAKFLGMAFLGLNNEEKLKCEHFI